MEYILCSACLMGSCCKYSGGSNLLDSEILENLRRHYRLLPVCPEVAGGLPVPRAPSERKGTTVVSSAGADVTEQYQKGAETALRLAEKFGCRRAILKDGSPSCGKNYIYDGTFSHTRICGRGVTAEKLMERGISVYSENE